MVTVDVQEGAWGETTEVQLRVHETMNSIRPPKSDVKLKTRKSSYTTDLCSSYLSNVVYSSLLDFTMLPLTLLFPSLCS